MVSAMVSFYKAILGEKSCGCFGEVTVNPWFTMLFDLLIVLVLLKVRPKCDNSQFSMTLVLISIGVWLLVGVPLGSAIFGHTTRVLDENGIIYGEGDEISLEPGSWIGKQFPLMDHVEMSELPKQGVWLVLLYQHTCSACRESVEQYSKLAAEFVQKENRPRIAIIEVPPFETGDTKNRDCPVVHGKLDGKQKWKLKTPLSILIDKGEVQNIFDNPLDTGLIRTIWREK
jgi:hypothetical protein